MAAKYGGVMKREKSSPVKRRRRNQENRKSA
jgi:hypothetical protein